MKEPEGIRWRDVWAVVQASAKQRLGKPLLLIYLALTVTGIAVVAVSIVVMHM